MAKIPKNEDMSITKNSKATIQTQSESFVQARREFESFTTALKDKMEMYKSKYLLLFEKCNKYKRKIKQQG